MDDKERLEKINRIARRAFGNTKTPVLLQDLQMIIMLASASDQFVEQNRAQFDANPPLDTPRISWYT
jgi:hypothetical protein